MQALAPAWDLDVQRGPGWLLVKLTSPDKEGPDADPLADRLWSMLERHFVYRLVLDLDQVQLLDSALLGQLVALYKRVHQRGGLMRLCGLSPYNRRVLQVHGLLDRFPAYGDLEEAVLGSKPCKPR